MKNEYTQKIDVTIWLKGFFSPKKDSFCEFSINTNGQAQLFIQCSKQD